jgi:hypothetical protein
MAAPKTDNKAIDDQPTPGAEFKVQLNVGLASFEALSHDPDNLGKIMGLMNGEGSWSTSHTDHKGNKTSITHGAEKGAAQASHKDVSGGHAVKRVAGGSHSQKGNGSNEENGEAKTEAVNGTVQKASAASSKDMSKGGNGQQHHKGDMTFSVEEGGIHYNVSKDFTVTSTGKLVHFDSKGDVSFKVAKNETHIVGNNLTIEATNAIQFQVGTSVILIKQEGISISTGGSSGIQIITDGSANILIKSNKGGVNIFSKIGNIIKSKLGGTTVETSTAPPAGW